jgi:hypothetical protein
MYATARQIAFPQLLKLVSVPELQGAAPLATRRIGLKQPEFVAITRMRYRFLVLF